MVGVDGEPAAPRTSGSSVRELARRFGFTAALSVITFIVSLTLALVPGDERMAPAGAIAVSVVAAAAVGLSGPHPLMALGAVVVATLVQPLVDIASPAMDLVIVLVVFQAAMRTALPPWLLIVACWVVLTVNELWQRPLRDGMTLDGTLLYPPLLTALAVGLGLQSRRIRRQNEELLRLRDADRLRFVLEERRRIARDVHDVAAHHLSAMVVRNVLARRLDTPEALRDAAQFTADTSRETLESLRAVVSMLNIERESPRSPAPRLSDLDDVLGRVRAAGLEVTASIGSISPIDDELEGVVVRIVQEALANSLQHAGPGRCQVEVSRADDVVKVSVSDEGRAPGLREQTSRSAERMGYGLVGMRERVESRGGTVSAGRGNAGGWVVSATLPVRA